MPKLQQDSYPDSFSQIAFQIAQVCKCNQTYTQPQIFQIEGVCGERCACVSAGTLSVNGVGSRRRSRRRAASKRSSQRRTRTHASTLKRRTCTDGGVVGVLRGLSVDDEIEEAIAARRLPGCPQTAAKATVQTRGEQVRRNVLGRERGRER